MARLNDDAQWIVLMGFIVSFSLFFLAILINQSTVVGQTTAEAVSEFPKNDIRGVREVIIASESITDASERDAVQREITILSLSRQNAAVNFTRTDGTTHTYIEIHYNNGVAAYNETYTTS